MKVRYFAWLRERLNRSEEEAAPPATVRTVADLMDHLAAQDEAVAMAFENRRLIKVAVDAEIVDFDAAVTGAETVAFFPYPTGG